MPLSHGLTGFAAIKSVAKQVMAFRVRRSLGCFPGPFPDHCPERWPARRRGRLPGARIQVQVPGPVPVRGLIRLAARVRLFQVPALVALQPLAAVRHGGWFRAPDGFPAVPRMAGRTLAAASLRMLLAALFPVRPQALPQIPARFQIRTPPPVRVQLQAAASDPVPFRAWVRVPAPAPVPVPFQPVFRTRSPPTNAA